MPAESRMLAVVPARGGSKGLPDKNIRTLAGLPLIEHSLRLAALCPDCHRRLERNPLRILDCKVEGCRAVVAHAPVVLDSLCDPCRVHFDEVPAVRRDAGRCFLDGGVGVVADGDGDGVGRNDELGVWHRDRPPAT